MFGLREIPYSAHVLISFWCDSDNKNLIFLCFIIFADISFFFILAIIFSYTPLLGLFLNICCMHIGPKEFAQ